MTLWLYLLQRGSAVILAPLVVAHLALIVIVSRDGLSAAEILARTQGSIGWAIFYGLFVAAAAVHAPIGLRNVIREATPWRDWSRDAIATLRGFPLDRVNWPQENSHRLDIKYPCSTVAYDAHDFIDILIACADVERPLVVPEVKRHQAEY